MRRLLVPPELLAGDAITLSGAPFHHLCRVLRTPVGAEVMVGDGRGLWLRCRLERAEKDCARLVVCERECHRDTALEVHLLQGLPKGDKLELVLQKATEQGTARLTPVLTARSVPVRDAAREGRRLERWQRIVTEATRQCGRAQVPQVDAPLPLAQALSQVSAEMRLVAWEEGGRSLSSLAENFSPSSVAVLIGPEGGFEASEVALAQDFGFLPVTLGPRILRTETAGMVLAAWLQLIWGDMG